MGINSESFTGYEEDVELVFLHIAKKDLADKSYGVYVGKFAGLSDVLTHKVTEIFNVYEKQKRYRS